MKNHLIALPLAVSLAGCAATETSIAKRSLDVQTKMTDTIFLEPVADYDRTVFVDVKNTSDRADLELEARIVSGIEARGYRVIGDPNAAQLRLQVNILQAGESSATAAERAYEDGFGSVFSGGAAGAGVGYGLGEAGGNNALLIVGGALLGAAIATAADAFVQDVTYTVITDVQVSERSQQAISTSEKRNNPQGRTGTITETSGGTTNWKNYRTRIVATANQANLAWPDAAPAMADGVTRSIAGIF